MLDLTTLGRFNCYISSNRAVETEEKYFYFTVSREPCLNEMYRIVFVPCWSSERPFAPKLHFENICLNQPSTMMYLRQKIHQNKSHKTGRVDREKDTFKPDQVTVTQ